MSLPSGGWRDEPPGTSALVIPEREAREPLSFDRADFRDETGGSGSPAAGCLQRENRETENVPVTGNGKPEERLDTRRAAAQTEWPEAAWLTGGRSPLTLLSFQLLLLPMLPPRLKCLRPHFPPGSSC